jgi:hypothetical protein
VIGQCACSGFVCDYHSEETIAQLTAERNRWKANYDTACAEVERLRGEYERKCSDCGEVCEASYPWYDYDKDGRRVVCVVCCPLELKDAPELRADNDDLRALVAELVDAIRGEKLHGLAETEVLQLIARARQAVGKP